MKIIYILLRVLKFIQIVNFEVHGIGNCEGPRLCCMGYMWDEEEAKCIRCDIGFIGTLCNTPCPYPLYGQECQKKCECEVQLCDPASGCLMSKCQKGYHGKFCTERCQYPKYGYMCSNTCTCGKGFCDFVSGCTNESTNTLPMSNLDLTFNVDPMKNNVIWTSTAENNYTANSGDQEPFRNAYIYILSTIIPVFVLGVIALVAFLKYKSLTRKSSRATKTDVYYHEINESPLGIAILDYNTVHIQAARDNVTNKFDSRNKVSAHPEEGKCHTLEVCAKHCKENEDYLLPSGEYTNTNYRDNNDEYLTVIPN